MKYRSLPVSMSITHDGLEVYLQGGGGQGGEGGRVREKWGLSC